MLFFWIKANQLSTTLTHDGTDSEHKTATTNRNVVVGHAGVVCKAIQTKSVVASHVGESVVRNRESFRRMGLKE
jgi:hypothetical protein